MLHSSLFGLFLFMTSDSFGGFFRLPYYLLADKEIFEYSIY